MFRHQTITGGPVVEDPTVLDKQGRPTFLFHVPWAVGVGFVACLAEYGGERGKRLAGQIETHLADTKENQKIQVRMRRVDVALLSRCMQQSKAEGVDPWASDVTGADVLSDSQ